MSRLPPILVTLLLLGIALPTGGAGDDQDSGGDGGDRVLVGDGPGQGGTPDTAVQAWILSLGAFPEMPAALEAAGSPFHTYEHLEMVSFVATPAVAHELAERLDARLDPNDHYALHLDASVPFIEADRVKEAMGPQRSGPTVLLVDTGIDSNHPDFQDGNLAANVAAQRDGGLVTGVIEPDAVVDMVGHGTHLGGIIAGTGAALGPQDPLHERYQGVYSNGRVASFQADTSDLPSDEPRVDTLAALESMDWAIENQAEYDIRATSFSWGRTGQFNPDHPLNQATLRLYLTGITVVFSAGNLGINGEGTLNQHCVAPWVLCIAAGDLQNTRAPYSSYGRTGPEVAPWDHPDLTAPGHAITAANPATDAPDSPGGALGLVDDILDEGSPSPEFYTDRSGTSMAAPHAAGVAGLVQAANPSLSPDQVMDILVDSTDVMADEPHKVGSGFLNARQAYNLAVQTVGDRAAFLAGEQVKYAGPQSGDPDYARDPLSHGFDAPLMDTPLILRKETEVWFLQTPMAWMLAAIAVLLAAVGTRFRE